MVAKKTAAKKTPKKRAVKKPTEPMETRIIFVIDESGSMGNLRNETVSSINSQLATLKQNAANMGTVYVSLVKFNHHSKIAFSNRAIESVYDVTLEQYNPNGNTALRDAMGDAIMELQKRPVVHKNTAYLVICVTDGWENASTRYNPSQLSSLIAALTATGNWTFTYLMANLTEAQREEFRQQYHASVGNMATFVPDSAGMMKSANRMGESLRSYSSARGFGQMSMNAFYSEPQTETVTPDALPQTTTTVLKADQIARNGLSNSTGGVSVSSTDTSAKWVTTESGEQVPTMTQESVYNALKSTAVDMNAAQQRVEATIAKSEKTAEILDNFPSAEWVQTEHGVVPVIPKSTVGVLLDTEKVELAKRSASDQLRRTDELNKHIKEAKLTS
jgi:von Willebrand factor type A domain